MAIPRSYRYEQCVLGLEERLTDGNPYRNHHLSYLHLDPVCQIGTGPWQDRKGENVMKKKNQVTKKFETKAVLRTMLVMGILTALFCAVPGAFASSASQAITESGKTICRALAGVFAVVGIIQFVIGWTDENGAGQKRGGLFIGVAVALVAVAEIVGSMTIEA